MKRALTPVAALLCIPLAAQAQEHDGVVVSATRVPQPSLEVPASVDRIYGEEIRQARPQVDLSESLGRVPGIVVQNRQNYAQDLQISSRGFGARSTFGVRGIRLIADGIPATMPDGQGQAATFPLGSAERIEVLRGPFSSLYGNASGGVISVETQDGPEVPTAGLDFHYGRYDTRRSALTFGGQWGALNGTGELSHFQTDGYRDHSAAERDHLNGKLRYSLSDATSVTLVANSLRQPETQDPLGLTRAQFDQDPRQVAAIALLFNTRKTVEQDQAGVTLAHRLGGASRLELTLYGGQRFVEQFLAIPLATQTATPTHSGGVVNLDRNFGGGALRYFTELGQVRLSAGVEREAMEERRRGFLNVNGVAGDLRRDEDNEVKSLDFFAQGEWKATERLSLHAGARRSRVAFESSDYFIVPGNVDDSGAKTYRATTPVAGVLFRLNRTTSVYGNVGRGFETPTFVELAYRSTGPGLNFDLEPSRSRHAELGVKTIAAGWLRVNAALFDVRTTNEIVVEQNTGGRATFKNAGRTDRTGYEVAAETVLGGPFEARVAYTYLDATFAEDFTTVAGLPAAPVTVPAGNLLPGVPRRQLYAELRYRQPGFFAQLDTMRRSRVAVDDRNTEYADGFQTYGAAAGLVQEGRDWSVTEYVRIDNLTDRNYVGSVIVNDGNGRYYEPSPRRSMAVGLQANLRF